MSVVIKGMKHPESCYDCKVSCETESGLHCLLVDDGNKWGWKKIESGEKPDWCPLVELPARHGKLIDGDALYDSLGVSDEDIYFKYMLEECPTIVEAEGD